MFLLHVSGYYAFAFSKITSFTSFLPTSILLYNAPLSQPNEFLRDKIKSSSTYFHIEYPVSLGHA